MDYSELFEGARKQISIIPDEQIFLAKDLFTGAEWNQLQRGEKLSFGKRFKNAVIDGKFPDVVYIGKAPNNSAQYKKTKRKERNNDETVNL